ncbi:MAG: HAD family phosphatase [Candidatus Eremiobacteraeota bacterium]|nr:HAD family phosphatase [Candidatus Eremiobacteraeota bacterium]
MTRPNDIRLVAIDIDGTLLGPDGTMSRENREAVLRLKAEGREVVLASGRSHANMMPFHKSLGLSSPLVSVHGGVVRAPNGRLHGAQTLDETFVAELTRLGRKEKVSVMLYRDSGVYLEMTTAVTEYDQSRNAEPQILVSDLLADCSGVHKVMWVGEPDDIARVQAEYENKLRDRADLYDTDPLYLEFVPKGVSKAGGLALLARELGVDSQRVAAFGDGNNDVPMLAWARFGVAMAHATGAARKAATLIGPEGCSATALARAIDLLFF